MSNAVLYLGLTRTLSAAPERPREHRSPKKAVPNPPPAPKPAPRAGWATRLRVATGGAR